MQLDIFDLMYEPLKINKPIRTLEFFGVSGTITTSDKTKIECGGARA